MTEWWEKRREKEGEKREKSTRLKTRHYKSEERTASEGRPYKMSVQDGKFLPLVR